MEALLTLDGQFAAFILIQLTKGIYLSLSFSHVFSSQ